MDLVNENVVDPLTTFFKNSRMLVRKCQKPNYTEFTRAAFITLMGFLMMGFLGFFIKLIFIPINNVILGA
ncbi:hypothetical protein AGDE_04118 [Angomonas deanei]|uniref:SecE/Sec61-gamma subunits of protein translocation complex, putative n=1 Tax=Angomonas deanei TaxID=59799 RepID=S9VYE0_9TRYP|nr:hypothetical protein AGDE_10336 [Angomonas deanei]EPY39810.1 hypothetical protein AGDE_04118 [Angomonas deanei]CAD2217248.1 SecE/Sec61-gamma subunits of protein translocation complex, putative [Angomonas deanei]|eukprot:EPY28680.1 hypothetical protein AGDE_10336 [Angomonas deanei]